MSGVQAGRSSHPASEVPSVSSVAHAAEEPGAWAHRRRWIIAAVLFLAVIAGFFDRISIAVLFTDKSFQTAMGTGFDPTRLGLLMTSFLIAYGVSNVLLSALVDLYGPSLTLKVSIVAWGLLMAAMGTAGSFGFMLACRALLGIAEGPQFSIANTLVARCFRPQERARANSVWTIGSPLGSAIGFPLTAWLVAHFGWRMSFHWLAALNLIVILPLALFALRGEPAEFGSARPAAARGSLGYKGSVQHFASDWRYWLVVLASCGTLIFLWGLNSWLPSYLVKQRHISPQSAGLYASLPFILTMFGQLGGSYLSDRIGKRALIAGMGLCLAGAFMFAVPYMPGPATASLVIGLSGFFWGTVTPVTYALILDVVPVKAIGTAVGFKNGISNMAGSLAPVAMGAIVAQTGSFDSAFLVLVASGLIGGLVMTPLMRTH